MKKLGRIYFFCTTLLFIPFLWVMIQTFKPVRNVAPEDVLKIEGLVTAVTVAPDQDLVITLEGDSHYYYINQGVRKGLTLTDLQQKILNRNVILYSVKRWTLFTRDGNMGHIAKLVSQNDILYNEIKTTTHE